MDTPGLGEKIRVKCTDDNASMTRNILVQADKITAIQREQDTFLRRGIFEHLVIRNTPVGIPCLRRGQHIMAEISKSFDDWHRKIFVGIEIHPPSPFA